MWCKYLVCVIQQLIALQAGYVYHRISDSCSDGDNPKRETDIVNLGKGKGKGKVKFVRVLS